ncbi:MAG: hypothetical protein V1816_01005 [Pseudomonadota bacterium]
MTKPDATNDHPLRGAPAAPRGGAHPWLRLAAGIGLTLLFIYGFGTLSQYIPGARRMARVIDERNLRAGAIYYTDFEEPAEGSEYIRNCLEYPPGRDRDPAP